MFVIAVFAGPALAVPAIPAYRVVDDDGMARPGNCGASRAAHPTIQSAVDASASGDAVIVCPGTYVGAVSLPRSIALYGPQDGVDARGRTGPEAVLTAPGAWALTSAASDVMVDGFTFADTDIGIRFTGGSGHTVVNDIFDANVDQGLYEISDGTIPTVIEHNAFTADATNVNSNGLFVGGVTADDISINENSFRDAPSSAMVLGSGTTVVSDVHVTDNDSVDDATFVVISNGTDVSVSGNVVDADAVAGGSLVYIGGSNDGLSVTDNVLGGTPNAAVRVTSVFGSANTNVTLDGNTIADSGYGVRISAGALTGAMAIGDNTFSGNGTAVENAAEAALTVNGNRFTGNTHGVSNLAAAVLDATGNWWGAASGPSDWGTGSGNTVGAEIDFFPWATSSAVTTMRACDGSTAAGVQFTGTSASEVICGSAGNDLIAGGGGADLILGGTGVDKIGAGGGADAVIGEAGGDKLGGGPGFDSIQGRAGVDVCSVNQDGGRVSTCDGG
jgi:hypothetical protein